MLHPAELRTTAAAVSLALLGNPARLEEQSNFSCDFHPE